MERIDALTIVLDKPMRIEDLGPLANAMKQLQGVIEVIPVIRQVPAAAIAEQRIRQELRQRVMQVLEPPIFGWPVSPTPDVRTIQQADSNVLYGDGHNITSLI